MTDKNVVKQLEELLEPIKKDLGGVKKDLGEIKDTLGQHSEVLAKHTKILDQHSKILENHGKKLDELDKKVRQNTSALVNVENTIKIYGDMYDVNNGNARKLEKRIDVLESNEGIVPPREYRLIDL